MRFGCINAEKESIGCHKGRKIDINEAGESTKRDAELQSSFVVMPPVDEAKSISCPVCKEVLKSKFGEDDEEWVWQDAIQVKDKVCRLVGLTVFVSHSFPLL